MNYIKKHKLTALGLIIGAVAGFLYYHFIGCKSGSCPISSNPVISTLYGALMGGFFLNLFHKEEKNSDYKNERL